MLEPDDGRDNLHCRRGLARDTEQMISQRASSTEVESSLDLRQHPHSRCDTFHDSRERRTQHSEELAQGIGSGGRRVPEVALEVLLVKQSGRMVAGRVFEFRDEMAQRALQRPLVPSIVRGLASAVEIALGAGQVRA